MGIRVWVSEVMLSVFLYYSVLHFLIHDLSLTLGFTGLAGLSFRDLPVSSFPELGLQMCAPYKTNQAGVV